MKLHNFLHAVYAQAEGPWFRVVLMQNSMRHNFFVCELDGPQYRTASQTKPILVSSHEVAELQEQGLDLEAEELRAFFAGVFRCHRSSIEQATAKTMELVKVYDNEAR